MECRSCSRQPWSVLRGFSPSASGPTTRWRQRPDDRYFLAMPFAVYLALLGWLLIPPPSPARPKLVVVITVDQLRPDYLTRWKSQLTGGLGQLVNEGAVFTDGYQDHAVTETAPGHSTILSGMWPAHTGIISNLQGVLDSLAPLLGTTGPGASPRRFRGTTLFDRSEDHTSELQSPDHLVCRLLLEKKKTYK